MHTELLFRLMDMKTSTVLRSLMCLSGPMNNYYKTFIEIRRWCASNSNKIVLHILCVDSATRLKLTKMNGRNKEQHTGAV